MEEVFNYTIFHFGDLTVRVASLLKIFLLVVVVMMILYLIKRAIFRGMKANYAKRYTIYKLVKYFILVFACVVGLQILEFDLSILLAGSAALLVGLGLGIQNLFSDFISGIILLFGTTLKVDDVIEVNGLICRVTEINLRTTTVLTREDKYIILPNTDLTRHHLNNWTLTDVASRFEVNVGVDYSSDVNLVMKILKEAAIMQKDVLEKPVPFARFEDYGESSLNFTVYFWSEEVFRVENTKSNIRVKIFEMFRENNITIPFPQRVIHYGKDKKTDKENS